eukprot:507829-Pleurochrysis_carterae.AAC.2
MLRVRRRVPLRVESRAAVLSGLQQHGRDGVVRAGGALRVGDERDEEHGEAVADGRARAQHEQEEEEDARLTTTRAHSRTPASVTLALAAFADDCARAPWAQAQARRRTQ